MSFNIRVHFEETQYPDLTVHLEELKGKRRAQRIRTLAYLGYMVERGLVNFDIKNIETEVVLTEPVSTLVKAVASSAAL